MRIRSNGRFVLDAQRTIEKVSGHLARIVDPEITHVRCGGQSSGFPLMKLNRNSVGREYAVLDESEYQLTPPKS
jgi:hypothetical protein